MRAEVLRLRFEEGRSFRAIAAELGVGLGTVAGIVFRHRQPNKARRVLSEREDRRGHGGRVLYLMADGRERTAREISQRLGVHHTTIWRWLKYFEKEGVVRCTRPGDPNSMAIWREVED